MNQLCTKCGSPLTCLTCAGQKGGSSTSEKKQQAARKALEEARKKRWPQKEKK